MMNKEQALNEFWNGFGITAYDNNSVPDNAPYPRITYECITDNFGYPVTSSASIWTRSSGWASAEKIKQAIEQRITRGGCYKTYSNGAMWIRRGNPFSVRSRDASDESVKQIMLNIEIEYIE